MIGRPLRFLFLTTGGWTAVRVAMLWPTIDSVPALIRAVAPPVAAATASFALAPPPVTTNAQPAARSAPSAPTLVASLTSTQITPRASRDTSPSPVFRDPLQPPPLRLPAVAAPDRPRRLGGSLWAVARGGPSEARPGNQLGGSQAGVRVTYALEHRLALAGRISSTLDGRQREAALGLDWQPGAMPMHVIVERRIALDGGRGGTAVMIVGGIDPRPLSRGVTIEAYAQAGAVYRDRTEPFADGAVRVVRRLADRSGVRIDLGLGGWAAAQRGAARVDLGPTLAVGIPLAGQRVRVALDWRQRVAGNARPGSGLALTIGGDF